MLSEQESTKTLQLLQRICERLNLPEAAQDKELKQLIETTQIETLTKKMEQVRDQQAAEPAVDHSNEQGT